MQVPTYHLPKEIVRQSLKISQNVSDPSSISLSLSLSLSLSVSQALSLSLFFLRERDAAKGQEGLGLPLPWQLAAGATSAVGGDWRPHNSNHRLRYPEAHSSMGSHGCQMLCLLFPILVYGT